MLPPFASRRCVMPRVMRLIRCCAAALQRVIAAGKSGECCLLRSALPAILF